MCVSSNKDSASQKTLKFKGKPKIKSVETSTSLGAPTTALDKVNSLVPLDAQENNDLW